MKTQWPAIAGRDCSYLKNIKGTQPFLQGYSQLDDPFKLNHVDIIDCPNQY